MKKRILSIFLAAMMVLTMIPVAAVAAVAASSSTVNGGNGNILDSENKVTYDPTWYDSTESDLYIWDESDFLAYGLQIQDAGSAGTSYKNQVIHIMDDLDFSNLDLATFKTSKFANASAENWFYVIFVSRNMCGIIDGHGHSIRGLNFSTDSGTRASGGLLGGYLCACGTYNDEYCCNAGVFDLTISGEMTGLHDDNNGGLFGYAKVSAATQKIVFDNVVVDVDIDSSKNYVGGFVGYVSGGVVEFNNCVSQGSIDCEGTDYAGFIGRCDAASLTMTACYSACEITGTGSNVGGFIGNHRSVKAEIKNCISSVNISSATTLGGFIGWELAVEDDYSNCVFDGTINGTKAIGGFAGKSQGMNGSYDNKLGFDGCVSVGSLTAASDIGGYVGTVGATNNTSASAGARETFATIENSAFYGNITVTSDSSNIGAIAGSLYCNPAGVSAASTLTVENVILGGNITYGNGVTSVISVGYIVGANKVGNSVTAKNIIAFTTDALATLEMIGTNDGTQSVAASCVTENAANMTGVNAAITSAFTDTFTTMPTDFPMPLGVVNMVRGESTGTEYLGYQNGTNSVRFVAGGTNTDYTGVGFDISVYANGALVSGGNTQTTDKVYSSIMGNVNGVNVTYTNEELDVDYIYTISCDNIPADKEITFVVKTYHVEDSATVYDDIYVVTVG